MPCQRQQHGRTTPAQPDLLDKTFCIRTKLSVQDRRREIEKPVCPSHDQQKRSELKLGDRKQRYIFKASSIHLKRPNSWILDGRFTSFSSVKVCGMPFFFFRLYVVRGFTKLQIGTSVIIEISFPPAISSPSPSTAGHQYRTWRLEDKWAAASRGNCEETKDQLAAGTSTPTSP